MFSVRTSLLLIPITLLASAPLHAGSLEDAVTLLEEGWQDRAEKQLEDLADRNPDNAEVWYQLAWARFYVNDFEGAEKNIDKAVKLDRDNPGYLILQGHSVGRRAQTGSKLKAIGRLGGLGYCTTRDRFDIPRGRAALDLPHKRSTDS